MKQRGDYTFKYNKLQGRHGWLRLTPAYSVKLVKEILQKDTVFSDLGRKKILDPFCGTATTGVVAAESGYNCDLYDINPFLVWLGKIKSSNFSDNNLNNLYEEFKAGLDDFIYIDSELWTPPMKNIERWWSPDTIYSLSKIRQYIVRHWGEPSELGSYNLLWIAFARLCIETSAADFNHISVSFKEETKRMEWNMISSMMLSILFSIIETAKQPLLGTVNIFKGDSRLLEYDGKYDLVITSPPYPNRISYIRELRPYMYWLNFLSSGEEAGELDWLAIGGTWGIATSRLKEWNQQSSYMPKSLIDVCHRIEDSHANNGRIMSQYVLKFFDDMAIHLYNLREKLNDNARLYYILGNSSFYGNIVHTESYISDILSHLGYSNINVSIIRKRNCKKELFEFEIKADWRN